MKLNQTHFNIFLFLSTLAATAAYLILGEPYQRQAILVTGIVLLALLLILLALRSFQTPVASSLPLFAVFWALLYTLLPRASSLPHQIGAFGSSLGRFFSRAAAALPILAVALVAIFLLRKFAKDSRHFLIVILYYLAYGTALTVLFMAAVYAVLSSEAEALRAAMLGPVFFGGVCLCLELAASFAKTSQLYRKLFFWLTLVFGILTLVAGPTAVWTIEGILLGNDCRLVTTFGVILLGALSLSLKTNADDYDKVLKGSPNQILAFFFFLWGCYSLLTMVWPQFFHQLVFFFGVPLAYLLYTFLRCFHGKKLPLMQKTDNSFLAGYCLSALVLLLALGRVIMLRPLYLVFPVALLMLRYVCAVLADKAQRPMVLHCFHGVASLTLLLAARVDLSDNVSPFPLSSLLITAFFWCVVCFFLAKVSMDTTHVYPSEYVVVNRVRAAIPVILIILTLLLLLFQ